MNRLDLSSYQIVFGPIRNTLCEIIEQNIFSKVAILVDENTKSFCLPRLKGILPSALVVQIESGEINKNIQTSSSIWSQMKSYQLDRNSLLINLGGGVIGDMGGFAASCYMRGIRFLQIPTTLLSQVDASVGGKLGVDFEGIKNFVGLFKDPVSVLIDPEFLSTLAKEELRSGFAEMIKHSLIADKEIWNAMQAQNPWNEFINQGTIQSSVAIKKRVVEQDPFEKGLRKILNFGHTIGHALETSSFNSGRPLLHGEAIALGMIAEAFLSHKHLNLNKEELNSITSFIHSIYPDILNTDHFIDTEVMGHMKSDKKNEDGKILFSLLEKIGSCTFNIPVEEQDIIEALSYCKSSYSSE